MFDEPAIRSEKRAPVDPALQGLCQKCRNSGFVIINRGGIIGVAQVPAGDDSEGKPKVRLQVCDHNADHGY
jgi:hypothetical protein